MKVLMFHGRAGGHNILPFLEYFNASTEHQLTFIYANDRTYFPKPDNIEYHKFSFSPFKLAKLSKVIGAEYDLIWYHGGHSALILFIFSLLRNKKSKFIFNVWNEWLIHKAKKGGIKGKMFQYGISHADIIHCNWHGTAHVLRETGWNDNIQVYYWGLQKENFTNHTVADDEETNQFIATLPEDKVKFFFPKSISPNSRHDLVIEAAEKLVKDGLTNFIVYLWLGNTNEEDLLEKYSTQINKSGLSEYVILQKHGFLSFGDMQMIWKKMDAGLQIAANEQLSTTFLEPQFYQKEIVVTDILPYRMYNEKFDLNIPLIPLESEAVYNGMKSIINGNTTSKEDLLKRYHAVNDNFNFSENIKKIIERYQKLS
ncbi:hypothetical protein [Owenweeksia hongkongensis]|uniref:hypothetical protein n=1 Tax=Owenweeksia hongkongensis TaxID=253245 RepID=UPI003A8F21C6